MASAKDLAVEILRDVQVPGLRPHTVENIEEVNRWQLRAFEMMREVASDNQPRDYLEFCSEVAKRLVYLQMNTARYETVEVFTGILKRVKTVEFDLLGSAASTLSLIATMMYNTTYLQ